MLVINSARKKSLFGKIFKVNIVIIIIGLTLSALIQYAFMIRFIDNELKSNLQESAQTLNSVIMGEHSGIVIRTLGGGLPVDFLDFYSQITGNYVLIISSDGRVEFSSNQQVTESIYEAHFNRITQIGEDIQVTNLGMNFPRMLTHRQIVYFQDEVIGAIFVMSPMVPGSWRGGILFSVFLFPMLLVTLISLIFSYILSRKITRPIKEISYAAKAFSKGEFKERVNVVGRDEISELSATFNQMADSLEKIENLRRTFVANVSHELRTPMTTIIGFIDGILDGTIPPDAQSEYLAIVLSESRRLSRLISDLLDIARMEDDEFSLDITEFDISEMIRQCVIGFELRIDEQNIALNVEIPDDVCNVRADRDGMWQVLTNLIDNAIKFTHQNLAVDVRLAKIGNNVKISIRNEGSGIAPEELAHIFERFYKTDKSRGVNREGTGLGLFIVKNILHMHGQNVTVNSVVGEFAEFTFSLPSAL